MQLRLFPFFSMAMSSTGMIDEEQKVLFSRVCPSHAHFPFLTVLQVKPICVPLLQSHRLSPQTIPQVSKHLNALHSVLVSIHNPREVLDDGMARYIFYPLSQMIKNNPVSDIPDHIVERTFDIITVLLVSWWWSLDQIMWRGLLVFCCSYLPSGNSGKEEQRDEEAQAAAVRCTWELLRNHGLDPDASTLEKEMGKVQISRLISPNILLLSETLICLLTLTASKNRSTQLLSLRTVQTLVELYFGEKYAPNILPKVVSTLSRLLLRREGKTHQQGEIVKLVLEVLQATIILGVGNDICIHEGAIRVYSTLDDFIPADIPSPPSPKPADPYGATKRTPLWLNATTAQLHNALNTFVIPLIDHPTPSALEGLIAFASQILLHTSQTLTQSQPLLLIPPLILSLHPLPEISTLAHTGLLQILSHSTPALLNTFSKLAIDNLAALPHLLQLAQDSRLLRCTKLLIAIASLSRDLPQMAKSISQILGPNGGIEKWGWPLLDGLEFSLPNTFFLPAQIDALLLQDNPSREATFPSPTLRTITDLETRSALIEFFRSWGQAAGDNGLYAVEWFVAYASRGSGNGEVSALWCAARLLEGIADAGLIFGGEVVEEKKGERSMMLKKHTRWLTKLISGFWERDLDEDISRPDGLRERDSNELVEYKKGLRSLEKLLDLGKNAKSTNDEVNRECQRVLYLSQGLQLLAISSSILEVSFSSLLMHALYPVLHSLVSLHPFISATAHATLLHISLSTGSASPANLLLSNFDYALGSVSRHLARHNLDMSAPKVLVVLIKLVGNGVVDRAGDVVEVCFDRLDDYHGYRTVVEGLVEVLLEVVKAVEVLAPSEKKEGVQPLPLKDEKEKKGRRNIENFLEWYRKQRQPFSNAPESEEEPGPYPQRELNEEIGGNEGSANASKDDTPKLSSSQKLIKQVVVKSVPFLTSPSPLIRARILSVLTSSISTLSSAESSLLPTIHTAWPFILNRFKDQEVFVVLEAAELVCALVEGVGDFVDTKVWEDIWPLFTSLIDRLGKADSFSALSQRSLSGHSLGPQSTYSSSYRLYSAILRTLTKAIGLLQLKDKVVWDVLLKCRTFLREGMIDDLNAISRVLYLEMAKKNADAVWLVLGGAGDHGPGFLDMQSIKSNAELVLAEIT